MTDPIETGFKLRATSPIEVAAVDAALRELGAPCRTGQTDTHTDTWLDDQEGTLAAAGIGLRLREDGTGRRLACTTRGTAGATSPAREEHAAEWPDAAPPAAARDLPGPLRDRIEPFVLDRPLVAFLQLVVHRDTRVLAQEGRDLCELAIDRVEAQAAGRSTTFQELGMAALDDVAANAQLAQALQQRLPLQRALDDMPAHATSALGFGTRPAADPVVDDSTPIADVVGLLVDRQLDAMRRAEVLVRSSSEAEPLHSMRVAVRRLRSIVRAFRDLWENDAGARLLGQLADIGRELGAVRDFDVLCSPLADACAELPEPLRAAAVAAAEWIGNHRGAANERMQAWLRSGDRLRAQGELERGLRTIDRTTPLSAARIADEVPASIAKAVSRVQKLLRAIPPELPFAPLHELRIAAKRLRYLAEEFATLPGHGYGGALAKVVLLQQALGVVCDHEIAMQRLLDWIRPAMAASTDPAMTAAALGGLAARHALAARKARKNVRRVLARVDRKKVWRRFPGTAESDANLANRRQEDMRPEP